MNTITLTKLLRALINGNDYPAGTNIIINRKELVYRDNISWYNNLLYMHKKLVHICMYNIQMMKIM